MRSKSGGLDVNIVMFHNDWECLAITVRHRFFPSIYQAQGAIPLRCQPGFL